jgi:hypothetical protein
MPIKSNDFKKFHRDGRFEQVVSNIYKTGNWKWADQDQKIIVNCGGVSIWQIQSLSDKECKLSKPNETLIMVKE